MKILYHHRTQGRWAEGVHIREVINAMRQKGHEVVVVSPPGVDPFVDALPTELRRRSLTARFLGWISKYIPQIGFELMELSYNFSAYIRMDRLLKKHGFDLVYERYAFFSYAGVLVANKHGLPLIMEVNEISGIKRQRAQILTGLAKRIERLVFTRATAIVTVSAFLKERIAVLCGASEKVTVIPNAVNIGQFDPQIDVQQLKQRLGIVGKTVVGFVGAFSTWDKLDFLVDVFGGLSADHPDMRLLLVGDGANVPDLKSQVARLGLIERVIFTGKVARNEVAAHISAMDIAVLPHSNPFGSPVVLFEFMAMSKPVIAANFGPIAEVVTDKTNGLLFEPENKEMFTRCLESLVGSADSRSELGNAARQTIVQNHLWVHNVEKILSLVPLTPGKATSK